MTIHARVLTRRDVQKGRRTAYIAHRARRDFELARK
jgi:hypothetical protein